jgi:short-subunit dehydrogenase
MSAESKLKMSKAVVTGASAGIGKVFADRLAKKGYDLILVARRSDRLDTVARELRERYSVATETVVADLAKAADLERVAKIIGEDTEISLLVNNAGTSAVGPVSEAKAESLEALVNINIIALSRLTMAVLPGFKSRDRGTIINIGSVVGIDGYPYTAIYGGTKAYVLNFTKALQAELAGTNVVAQLVAPSATVSEIWDVQGFPLSQLDPAIVMSTEHCVDAALRGLELGEKITLPSVEDSKLLRDFESSSAALMAAGQSTGKPATRYGLD